MKIRNYLRQEWNMYLRNVLLRDKCEFCGSSENLHVHHENRFHDLFIETLKELEMLELEVEEYPEYDLNLLSNVLLGKQLKIEYKTLCRDCHMKLHMDKKKNGEYNQNSFSQYGSYFFIDFKLIKSEGIKGNLLPHFMKLCTCMDFNNQVRLGKAKGDKGIAELKDLQEILNLKKTEFFRVKKELFEKEMVTINKNKKVIVNKKYAIKGYNSGSKKSIVFSEEFNKIYKEIPVKQYKVLGNAIMDNDDNEQIFEFVRKDFYETFKHKYRVLKEINEEFNIFKTKGSTVMFNPQLFFFEGYQDIREMIKRYEEF